MHCSVIFMHTLLYNILFKRDMPFLRHNNKKMFEEIILLLFIASVKSQKTINALQKWVHVCFITVTFKIVTLNKEQHCHQMHDKPKYENGKCLINLVIGWVK